MPFSESALIQRLPINVTALGDNTIVSAVAGKLIYVVGMILSNPVATANNVIVKDGTGGTALTGPMAVPAAGPAIVLPQNVPGGFDWFATSNVANNLVLNLSAATQIGGAVWFIQQ